MRREFLCAVLRSCCHTAVAPALRSHRLGQLRGSGVFSECDLPCAEQVAAYLYPLLSLLFGAATTFVAIALDGRRRDDLDLEELCELLRRKLVACLEFDLPFGAQTRALRLEVPRDSGSECRIHGPFLDVDSEGLLRLQCAPSHTTRPAVLAVPVCKAGFPLAACHALVGIAVRSGGFSRALLQSSNGDSDCNWLQSRTQQQSLPLVSSLDDGLWSLGNAEADQDAALWFTPQRVPDDVPAPDAAWWSALDEFLRAPCTPPPARPRDALGR